jgi:hypothetical protein
MGFASAVRLCHEHKVTAAINFFAKKESAIKPEMFYITFDCCHLNWGPNPARTRTSSLPPGPGPGPGPGPCRPLAHVRDQCDLYSRPFKVAPTLLRVPPLSRETAMYRSNYCSVVSFTNQVFILTWSTFAANTKLHNLTQQWQVTP